MEKELKWTENLSVGYDKIDQQHQHLFQLANELFLHSDADSHSEIVSNTLYELIKYTKYHFSDEEAFFESLGYPNVKEHKEKHYAFLLKMATLSSDVVEGKSGVTRELVDYLYHWLKEHTSSCDQEYKEFI